MSCSGDSCLTVTTMPLIRLAMMIMLCLFNISVFPRALSPFLFALQAAYDQADCMTSHVDKEMQHHG